MFTDFDLDLGLEVLWFKDVMCLLCWSWTWVVFWLIFREQGWHQLEYCRCNLFRSVLWSCLLGVSCNVNYFRLSFCLMVWANSPLGEGPPWVEPCICTFLLFHPSVLWSSNERIFMNIFCTLSYEFLHVVNLFSKEMTKSTLQLIMSSYDQKHSAHWRRNEKLTLNTKAHIL